MQTKFFLQMSKANGRREQWKSVSLVMNAVKKKIWFFFVNSCELMNAFDTISRPKRKIHLRLFRTMLHTDDCEQPNNIKHQLKTKSSQHSWTIALAKVFFCYFGESNASQLHRQHFFFCKWTITNGCPQKSLENRPSLVQYTKIRNFSDVCVLLWILLSFRFAFRFLFAFRFRLRFRGIFRRIGRASCVLKDVFYFHCVLISLHSSHSKYTPYCPAT